LATEEAVHVGTPPGQGRARLDPQQIFAEALLLLDSEGAAGFTVAALARRLGVQGPSLYQHVASKAEIIEGVRAIVVSKIDYFDFGVAPWDIALKGWARSYLAAFSAHPNTIGLLATTPVSSEELIQQYEAAAAALLEAGWPASEVLFVITAIESLVLGSALDVTAPDEMVITDASTHPALSQALVAQHSHSKRALATFELALDALVSGFALRLTGRGVRGQ
jgi:AcrR family transcriptional regulator